MGFGEDCRTRHCRPQPRSAAKRVSPVSTPVTPYSLEDRLIVQVSRHDRGIILDCHGALNRSEISELPGAIRQHCHELGWISHLMVDLTNAVLSELSTADLQALASLAVRKSSYVPTLVAAIIVRRDLDFGLSRMWQTFIDQTGWTTMVCRTRVEAEVWIAENVIDKSGEATG
jgi:hypothetical protein